MSVQFEQKTFKEPEKHVLIKDWEKDHDVDQFKTMFKKYLFNCGVSGLVSAYKVAEENADGTLKQQGVFIVELSKVDDVQSALSGWEDKGKKSFGAKFSKHRKAAYHTITVEKLESTPYKIFVAAAAPSAGKPPPAPAPAAGASTPAKPTAPAASSSSGAAATKVPDISRLAIGTDYNAAAASNNEIRQITVEAQNGRMDEANLRKLFGTRTDYAELQSMFRPTCIQHSWPNAQPPQFELVTADRCQRAVDLYDGWDFEEFEKLKVKIATVLMGTAPPVSPPTAQASGIATYAAHDDDYEEDDDESDFDESHPLDPPAQNSGAAQVPVGGMQMGQLRYTNHPIAGRAWNQTLKFGGSSNKVFANYVRITDWPKKVYEYNINFGKVRTGENNENGNPLYRVIGQMRSKKSIIATMSQHPPLSKARWATDYKNIFSLDRLWDEDKDSKKFGPVRYRRPDGRVDAEGPVVKLTFARQLDMPPSKVFNLPMNYPHRERIVAAFNAFVSDHAKAQAQNSGVVLVGPNKFFKADAHSELSPRNTARGMETFLAYRGFSLSTRPAANDLLLSIAPLTSAVLRPISVKDWISRLMNQGFSKEDAVRSLVGIRCRLVHNRQRHNPGDPNPNLEDNRIKHIVEFGNAFYGRHQQRYKPRGHPAGAALPLVQSCFTDLLSGPGAASFNGADCVNVGIKLAKKRKNLTESSRTIRTLAPADYSNLQEAIWIPSNLLEIEPYQIYSKVLKGDFTSQMIRAACKTPAQNRSWVEQAGLRFLGINPQLAAPNWMTNLELAIGKQLIEVPVKKLSMPTIMFHNVKPNPKTGAPGGTTKNPGKGASWDLMGTTFKQRADIDQLTIVRFTCQTEGLVNLNINSDHRTSAFSAKFREHGITCRKSTGPDIVHDLSSTCNESSYCPTIWSAFKGFAQTASQRHVHVILLPKWSIGLYAAIKRAADYHGVYSLCFQADKADKGEEDGRGGWIYKLDRQIISNLCLKINAKFGQAVHNVRSLQDSALNSTLVLGADIGAIKGTAPGIPSVACVVGTVDNDFMNMPGSMRPIAAKSDIIPAGAMQAMVYERITDWAAKHGKKLPANILFYRDGVSQSQYDALLAVADPRDGNVPGSGADKTDKKDGESLRKDDKKTKKKAEKPKPVDGEVRAIELAWKQAQQAGFASSSKGPNITLIVVGKRHNTRFFPSVKTQTVSDRNGNLAAGHLIDSTVTLVNNAPIVHNFFLQSHTAIQGTARTAHYIVLKNGMKLTVDQIHNITQGFCFAYTRATKGVSYCAPAYHADRLCARGEAYMKHIARTKQNEPWWMPSEPDRSADYPTWFRSIADNVANSHDWLGDGGHGAALGSTKNPWHPKFNSGMFYI